MFVLYSTSANGEAADIRPDVAPAPGEPVVKAGPDKFIGTKLRELLSGRGIKTVIVTGAGSEGAVLDTTTDAALHGLTVVVPVDAMSSTEPYAEQYMAWHVTHAPGVSQKTTLTRTDLIGF